MAKSLPFRTRQCPRLRCILPVNLLVEHGDDELEQPGSTIDLSPKGLRVQSSGLGRRGEEVEVLSMRGRTRLAHCRVAWVHEVGSEQRCRAGLEILN